MRKNVRFNVSEKVTNRRRRRARLKLGPDFSEAQCLSVSEVRLVMEAMIYDYNNRNEDASSTNTQVFEKTLKYVQRFGGNVSQEAVQLIRDMLTKQNGLHTFERRRIELTSGGLRRGKDISAVTRG